MKNIALLVAAGLVSSAAAQPIIGFDDDDGIGLLSVLSFGTGSGQTLGDGFNLGGDGIANGEDGALAGGSYILAIGAFDLNVEDIADLADLAGDTSAFSGSGAYSIDLITDSGVQTLTGDIGQGEFDLFTISFSGAFLDVAVTSADFDSELGLFAVPTPGAAAVLGLGGIAALRRRR